MSFSMYILVEALKDKKTFNEHRSYGELAAADCAGKHFLQDDYCRLNLIITMLLSK